mgnify:CR=1 FL=1
MTESEEKIYAKMDAIEHELAKAAIIAKREVEAAAADLDPAVGEPARVAFETIRRPDLAREIIGERLADRAVECIRIDVRARIAYANALAAARGETVAELPGRDLRQRIGDEAAVEERDEHGVPRLRGG